VLTTFELENACVAVWSGVPTTVDCDVALRAAERCYARNGKRPIVLVSVLRSNIQMPSPVVYARMALDWPKLMSMALTIQCVLPPRAASEKMGILSMLLDSMRDSKRLKQVGAYCTLPIVLTEIRRASPGFPIEKLEDLITAEF
jgi:hypothetical protein